MVVALKKQMEGWNAGKMGYWVEKADDVLILISKKNRLLKNR